MIERRPMELFYTVGEIMTLWRVSRDWVDVRLRRGDFGPVVDLGDGVRPDYRVSLTALNSFLDRHQFNAAAPVYARTVGELRRKAGARPRNGGEFAPMPVNSTLATV